MASRQRAACCCGQTAFPTKSHSNLATDMASVVLSAYQGIIRVTVHLKDNYETAVRVVVNPASDSWKSFLKDIVTKLRLRTSDFTLLRSSTKAILKSFSDIRQNDIITVDPKPIIIDNTPLTDSPLSIARTGNLRYESVGPTSQLGCSLVVLCTMAGTHCFARRGRSQVDLLMLRLVPCLARPQVWTTCFSHTLCD